MNLADFSLRNRTTTTVLAAVLIGAGIVSFTGLSRLEDPEFTIKEALVITPYPGATALEVEQEVSDKIEQAVQQLGQLKEVESKSDRGLSTVTVRIKDKYDKVALPQVWDELRRKVNDVQGQLPPGAGPSIVNDDYADTYGVFLALTGEGYTHRELYDFAKVLRRELLLVDDVKRIPGSRTLDGQFTAVQQAIGTHLDRPRAAEFLQSFVDEAIASGFVAELIEKHGVSGRLSVAKARPLRQTRPGKER